MQSPQRPYPSQSYEQDPQGDYGSYQQHYRGVPYGADPYRSASRSPYPDDRGPRDRYDVPSNPYAPFPSPQGQGRSNPGDWNQGSSRQSQAPHLFQHPHESDRSYEDPRQRGEGRRGEWREGRYAESRPDFDGERDGAGRGSWSYGGGSSNAPSWDYPNQSGGRYQGGERYQRGGSMGYGGPSGDSSQFGGGGTATYGDRSMGQSRGRHTGKGPKGYRRSDESVIDEVSRRLEQDSEVDASEIEVTCSEGIVTLTGTVEDRNAKRCAEDCAAEAYGVKDVKNELRIESRSGRDEQDSNSSGMGGSRSSGSQRGTSNAGAGQARSTTSGQEQAAGRRNS
jgi:osmotically-inducible protein OsmY